MIGVMVEAVEVGVGGVGLQVCELTGVHITDRTDEILT